MNSIKFVIMKHTLGKEERLKSKKLIERLYEERNSVKAYPLRMIFYKQSIHQISLLKLVFQSQKEILN